MTSPDAGAEAAPGSNDGNTAPASATPTRQASSRFGRLARLLPPPIVRLLDGQIAGAAMTNFGVIAVGAVVSLVVAALLARVLGRQGLGVYYLATALANAALVFGKLELDTTAVKFVGAYAGTQRWGLLRGFLTTSRRAVLASSAIVAAAGVVVVRTFLDAARQHDPLLPAALYAACALLPATAVLVLHGAMLQGFRRYLASQLPNQLLRPLFLGAFVGGLVLLHRQLTPAGVMLANLAATLVAVGFTLRPLREARPAPARQVAREYDHADWRHTALGLLVVALAQFVISQQSDVLVVGTLLGTSESAVYGAAGQLTTLISFGITSVSFVATPLIAAAYARGAPEELQRLIRAINRINIAVCVPLVLGIILIGKWLLALVFGSAFAGAYPVLVILSCAQLVVGLIGSLAGFLLTMTSHQRAAGWIIGGSAVFNLVLTLILTPRFGVIGTATATLLAASARSIVLAIYIRARMGLQLLVV